jgi:hypothetical protein
MGKQSSKRLGPPPLTDADIREALLLQSATIRAVTEVLQKKGLLDHQDLILVKNIRDALAAELRARGDQGSSIITPDRLH